MRVLSNLARQSICSNKQSLSPTVKRSLTWQECLKKDLYVNNLSLLKSSQRVEGPQRAKSPLFVQSTFAEKIKLWVGDFSGTVTDPFSTAPVEAINKAFYQYGVSLYKSDIRKDMGLPKEEHIKKLLGYPQVRATFERDIGRLPDLKKDVPALYELFLSNQLHILNDHNILTPGAKSVLKAFKRKHVAIGFTTGFPREIANPLLQGMAKQGLVHDFSMASDDLEKYGERPYPHMIHEIMRKAGVHNPTQVIKCGDTPSDCGEGLSARTWVVGIYGFGNGVGINSLDEYYHLVTREPEELELKRYKAEKELIESGAHYVVFGPRDLIAVYNDINERLADNQTPDMCHGLAREQLLASKKSSRPSFRRG